MLNLVECRRCGFKWAVSPDKRDRRDLLCRSCTRKPAKVITYGKLRCEPYQGDLNDELQPIDENGEVFLPGVRICGHSDCVNVKHIVSNQD